MKKKKISGLMLFATTVMMLLCLTGCGFIGSKKPYDATVTDSVRLKTDSTYDKADSVLILNLDVQNNSNDYLDPSSVAYDTSASLDDTPLDMEYLSDYCPVYISTNAIAPKEHGTVQVAFKLGSPDADGTVSILMLTYGKKKSVKVLETTIDLEDVEYYVIPSDYELQIDRAFTTDDGEGNQLLALDMTFTNNSDETTSPAAAHLSLFQDGVELSYGYLPYRHPETDDELSDNSYKDIQPGKSISYRSVYTLKDDSEVAFIARENTYTGYEIEPILETKIAVAEDAHESKGTIVAETLEVSSAFEIEVTDYVLGLEEYSDIPIVVFMVDFTNNSEETACFSYDMDDVASQGGVSLDNGYISGISSYNSSDVQPGATATIFLAYELRELSNDIELTITDDTHYARPVIFQETYTLDEIVEETIRLLGDDDEVLDEDALTL